MTFFGLYHPRLMHKANLNPVFVCAFVCVCVCFEISCEVGKSVTNTSHFKKKDTTETLIILKRPLDCNSSRVIYLFESKQLSISLSLRRQH